MITVKDKKVIIVGTGKSGIGSAVLLEKNGALPVLYDSNDKIDIEHVKTTLEDKLKASTKAEIYVGEFPCKITEGIELAVLSPGVPVDADFVWLIEINDFHFLHQLFIENGWTFITAISTMIFCLMHWPCSTTCLTIKKETQSFKWTLLSFFIPTLTGIFLCFLFATTARAVLSFF